LHGALAVARRYRPYYYRDGWKCSWDSEWACSETPSHIGENLSKDFEQDELQTRHQSKEERFPPCSISRLSILWTSVTSRKRGVLVSPAGRAYDPLSPHNFVYTFLSVICLQIMGAGFIDINQPQLVQTLPHVSVTSRIHRQRSKAPLSMFQLVFERW